MIVSAKMLSEDWKNVVLHNQVLSIFMWNHFFTLWRCCKHIQLCQQSLLVGFKAKRLISVLTRGTEHHLVCGKESGLGILIFYNWITVTVMCLELWFESKKKITFRITFREFPKQKAAWGSTIKCILGDSSKSGSTGRSRKPQEMA